MRAGPGAQLLDAEQRDDVLQLAVVRDGLRRTSVGDAIVLLADDGGSSRIEDEPSGSIAGYMPSAAIGARQHDHAVEMA